MAALLTLVQAKNHLRVFHAEEDEDINLKLQQATDIVIDYVKVADSLWTSATVPGGVQAAILQVLTDLWRHRGSDEESTRWADDRVADGYLSPQVTRLLHRYRDPALA